MKLFFTYTNEVREGYESKVPLKTSDLENDSVDEIIGDYVLEKVSNLTLFIEECYRIIRKGGVVTFTSPYFSSSKAWVSPLTVRALSELSLNFADKNWREANKFSEVQIIADFEVVGSFAIEESGMQRAEEVRRFWMDKYLNVVQAVIFKLTKRQ